MTFSRREKELGKVRENRQSMKSLWTIISNFDFQLSDVKRSKHSEEDNEEIIVDVGNTDSSSEHESFYPPTTTHSEAPEHHESSEHEAEKKDEDLDNLVGEIEAKLTLAEDQFDETDSLENCYSKDGTDLKCNFRPGVYKREGHLRNHLKTKHNQSFELICKCGKIFADSTRLNRHKKLSK